MASLDEMITVKLLAKEATDKGYDKDPVAQQEMRAIFGPPRGAGWIGDGGSRDGCGQSSAVASR